MIKRFIKKSILKRINGFRNLDGWLTDDEAVGLYRVARKLPGNAIIVEIGSWQGKSTYCLAKGLGSGKVHVIDPFNADGGLDTNSEKIYKEKKGEHDLLEQFKQNMKSLNVETNIIIHQGYSYQFNDEFNKIDLLFIDGDHSIKGCQLDFDLYSPKIIKGGFIAFHDFYETRDKLGPTYVIKNSLLHSTHFEFYAQFDSLWIAKKIN
jgi:predicted O-methyltransferase YrrM